MSTDTINLKIDNDTDTLVRVLVTIRKKQFFIESMNVNPIPNTDKSELIIKLKSANESTNAKALGFIQKLTGVEYGI